MYSEAVVIAKYNPDRLIGSPTRSGGILNQPEGVVFAITTASLYIIPLITWLPTK